MLLCELSILVLRFAAMGDEKNDDDADRGDGCCAIALVAREGSAEGACWDGAGGRLVRDFCFNSICLASATGGRKLPS